MLSKGDEVEWEIAKRIVQPIGGDTPEITARFRDPAGNVLGLYQEPIRSKPVQN